MKLPDQEFFFTIFLEEALRARDDVPTQDVFERLMTALKSIYEGEFGPTGHTARDSTRNRDHLWNRARKAEHFHIFHKALTCMFNNFTDVLPTIARMPKTDLGQSRSPSTIPLRDVADLPQLIQWLVLPLYSMEAREAGFFDELRDRVDSNLERIAEGRAHLIDYLEGTPLLDIFHATVPASISSKSAL